MKNLARKIEVLGVVPSHEKVPYIFFRKYRIFHLESIRYFFSVGGLLIGHVRADTQVHPSPC